MKAALKTCPFCGSEAKIHPPTLTKNDLGTDPNKVFGKFYSSVVCSKCYCSMGGPDHDMDCSQVIEKWNTRV